MKVNPAIHNTKPINFKGYQTTKDKFGNREYYFNFPFDESKYECFLEIFHTDKDLNGNYKVGNKIRSFIKKDTDSEYGIPIKSGGTTVNLNFSYMLPSDEPIAYHYKLYEKGNYSSPTYHIEAGSVIDNSNDTPDQIYNLVTPHGSSAKNGGAMKLLMPDFYNPLKKYNDDNTIVDAEHTRISQKNFSNKIGGSLAGIEHDLEAGKFDGYKKIISTPIFTDDSLSAHSYWNKNCMQMSHSLGNINNYASLQRKLFTNGINWVSDGAFVNEGIEGTHFKHVLKYGEESPFYNWFKISGMKESPLALGIFSENKEFIGHKLVNPRHLFKQDSQGKIKTANNPEYDPDKPTFVQIYDKRLATPSQVNSNKLIEKYDKASVPNALEINNHNDTVMLYSFEINPETYKFNIERINEYNSAEENETIDLASPLASMLLTRTPVAEGEEKFESGFETWDANVDIAKLDFGLSNSDTIAMKSFRPKDRVNLEKGITKDNLEVQDYIINSSKYWTRKTNQIHNIYAAQQLTNITKDTSTEEVFNRIKKLVNSKTLPESLKTQVDKEVVESVMDNSYNLKEAPTEDYNHFIQRQIAEFPLDSVEFGDDIAAVFASPYFTKRASCEEELGMDRIDIIENNRENKNKYSDVFNRTDRFYNGGLKKFVTSVVEELNRKMPENSKFNNKNEISDYGGYVLPLLIPEIVKFAAIKGLFPDTIMFTKQDNGEIYYRYDQLKKTSMWDLGIRTYSVRDEASSLLSKFRRGVNKISSKDVNDLTNSLNKMIKGTSLESFRLANMIVDKSGAGLDWRIDATKDIADVDSLRDRKTPFGFIWNQVIDFWKNFTTTVRKENPSAYIAAEITDENDLYDRGNGNFSRFNKDDIVKKFLSETGMTAVADYKNFFNGVPEIFARKLEDGEEKSTNQQELGGKIFEQMIGNANFVNSSDLESLIQAYTFIGNHDKPRALHALALNMKLFYTDLTNPKNPYRETAFRLLENRFIGEVAASEVDNYDYSKVDSKAIAMGESIKNALGAVYKELVNEEKLTPERKEKIFIATARAITSLVNGEYLGKKFQAEAFGVKPIDISIDCVLKQAAYFPNFEFSEEEYKMLKDETFKKIMDPAISRLLGIMKFLVALPGNPTLFAGDELGASGYESKTKNIYLQNRNELHHDWADFTSEQYKPFIQTHRDEIEEVMALRSRNELRALNDGAIFTLPKQYNNIINEKNDHDPMTAILRHCPDGAMAISVFNTEGVDHRENEYYKPKTVYLKEINLTDDENNRKVGLRGGLNEGTEFRNAKNPGEVYVVCKNGNHYSLRKKGGGDIKISDTTLVLYHDPKPTISFMGNSAINLYAKPAKQPELGSKLALLSR